VTRKKTGSFSHANVCVSLMIDAELLAEAHDIELDIDF
jgi:hypothetical protein